MEKQSSYDLPVMDAREMKVRPALFLDFDGTIRTSKSGAKFIKNKDDIALLPNVEHVLWKYRNDGYLILGCTNQGGVAFMIKPPSEIMAEIDVTLSLFEKNPFHGIKVAFHHPKGSHPAFGHESLMRKPAIGMLVMHELDCFNAGYIIDYQNSLFVGDRDEDAKCAINAFIGFEYAWDFFGFEEPPLETSPNK